MARTVWRVRTEPSTSKACWAYGQLGVDDRLRRHGAQVGREASCLRRAREEVVGAVDHEERRRVVAQVVLRRCQLPRRTVVRERGGEHHALEVRLESLVGEPLVVDEVVDAVHRHRGLHRRVDVLETGLELGLVRRERGERGEVTARRSAGQRHERRVAAVLGDVLLDPGDGPLHVDDVGRPLRLRREAVVDRHADPAALGEV